MVVVAWVIRRLTDPDMSLLLRGFRLFRLSENIKHHIVIATPAKAGGSNLIDNTDSRLLRHSPVANSSQRHSR